MSNTRFTSQSLGSLAREHNADGKNGLYIDVVTDELGHRYMEVLVRPLGGEVKCVCVVGIDDVILMVPKKEEAPKVERKRTRLGNVKVVVPMREDTHVMTPRKKVSGHELALHAQNTIMKRRAGA